MSKLLIRSGSTSVIDAIFIGDATVTTGAGKTGLTNSSVTAYFWRDGDTSATAISVVSASLGTWTSGGFIQMDATNMPGWYEIGLPNAVFANAVRSVRVMYKGTNLVPVNIQYQIDGGVVTVTTNSDKTGYSLTTAPPTTSAIAAAILANTANLLATDASGRVTLVPADVPPTVAAIAAGILATPANLLATDAIGRVTVGSVTGNVTVGGYAAGQDPFTLVWNGVDSVDGITNCNTPLEYLRVIMAVLAGLASGMATTTAVFEAITGLKARVTATVDANGNRTAITLNGS